MTPLGVGQQQVDGANQAALGERCLTGRFGRHLLDAARAKVRKQPDDGTLEVRAHALAVDAAPGFEQHRALALDESRILRAHPRKDVSNGDRTPVVMGQEELLEQPMTEVPVQERAVGDIRGPSGTQSRGVVQDPLVRSAAATRPSRSPGLGGTLFLASASTAAISASRTGAVSGMDALSLHRNEFYGHWNYELHPR